MNDIGLATKPYYHLSNLALTSHYKLQLPHQQYVVYLRFCTIYNKQNILRVFCVCGSKILPYVPFSYNLLYFLHLAIFMTN